MNKFRSTFASDYRAATRGRRDCPESDQLARLVDGHFWPWQRQRLVGHVSECAHCADEMQVVLSARDDLREALDMDSPARPLLWPAAGLATVAAAGLVAVWLWAPLASAPQMGPGAQGDVVFVSNFDASNRNNRAQGTQGQQSNQDLLFSSDFDRNASG